MLGSLLQRPARPGLSAFARPSRPNPRTGLPSHLAPTLELIDRLLEDGAMDEDAFVALPTSTRALHAIDGAMQQARGQDEVLSLLEDWSDVADDFDFEQVASAKAPAVSGQQSQSWPKLPTFERAATTGWDFSSGRVPPLFSPRSSRRLLCALDEAEPEAACSAFDLSPRQRVELRALAKAVAVLLDALLALLLQLTERVVAARDYWSYFALHPLQYVIWRGPSRWRGLRPFSLSLEYATYLRISIEPVERTRALTELIQLMAAHVGRVHAALVGFLKCTSRAELQDALAGAVETLHGLLSPRSGASPPLSAAPPLTPGAPADAAAGADGAGARWPSAAAASQPRSTQRLLDEMRAKVHAAARRWAVYERRLEEELDGLDVPTHVGRNWLRYTAGAGLALCAGLFVSRHSADMSKLAHGLAESLAQWWREHLKQPLSYMYHEIVHRRYLVVSDPQQLDDARRSLQVMVRGFCERHRASLFPDQTIVAAARGRRPEPLHEAALASVAASADALVGTGALPGASPGPSRGDGGEIDLQLHAISRLFEKQAGSAVYNLVSGDLVEIMLIQMAMLKKEVFEMMAALDTLMRENYFTASMMAMMPGGLALSAVLLGLWRVGRKVSGRVARKHSRRFVQKRMRNTLRDIERLLLRYHSSRPPVREHRGPLSVLTEPSAASSAAAGQMSPQDRGTLLLELHTLLQQVRNHVHLFENTDLQNLVEDLRDLECDSLSAEQKLITCSRICRTQPILGLSSSTPAWAVPGSRAVWHPASELGVL